MSPRPPDFGRTWWGKSWVDSLEQSSESYQSRLPRGRTYARKGAVRDLEIHPGHVGAAVVGSHGELYRVDIAVRTLSEGEWEQIASSIASKSAHLAALLDGELLPGIVDDAAKSEIRLLPGPSDLRPDCSCPDWVEPCKHAAAVCYLVAQRLDSDPFLLFHLRGKPREELLTLVRARRSGAELHDDAPATEAIVTGADAHSAWMNRGIMDPLPPLPNPAITWRVGEQPGRRAPWTVDIPAIHGINAFRVDALGDDAVDRAWRIVTYGEDSMVLLNARADLARRASKAASQSEVADLANRAGVSATRLSAWIEGWRMAGADGVAVLADHNSWVTDQELLSEGREQLVAAGHDRRSIALNYDSLRMGHMVLLVLGPGSAWYKLLGSGGHHDLRLQAFSANDVTELVDDL